MKNECADYTSRNNFDALIGARCEALAKEAFSRMDVHLDLNMTMIRPLDGLHQAEYLKEFGDIYKRTEKRLEPVLVNPEQWKRDKSYLWHEDRIVVPSDRVPAILKWTHESSGHVGADRTLRLFKQCFHTTWTDDQLRKTLQPIVDKCPCRSCKPGDIRDRGLYSTLPFPHCANSVLYFFKPCQHLQGSCGSVLCYKLEVWGCQWLNATTHGLNFPHMGFQAHLWVAVAMCGKSLSCCPPGYSVCIKTIYHLSLGLKSVQ